MHALLIIGSLVDRVQDHIDKEATFASLPEPDFDLSTACIAFLIVACIDYLMHECPSPAEEWEKLHFSMRRLHCIPFPRSG
jgi:hypothetical protein